LLNVKQNFSTKTYFLILDLLSLLLGKSQFFNNNNNNNNNNKGSMGMGEVAPLYGVDPALVLTNPGVQ
jgi:hypothetical protein